MATQTPPATARAEATAPEVPIVPPREGEDIEADDADDSASDYTDYTTVTSSMYKGVIQNGRRYQSYKEGEYWGPADEQQFESMANTHLAYLLHDQFQENRFFRSPIGDKATHILDIGTADGAWASDVADEFPNVTVRGVDLYPPPNTWIAPNCILEVDDVTERWVWKKKFDLVHLRYMLGSFTEKEWDFVYSEAYKNLKPGGWIEQSEISIDFFSDDDSIPADSPLTKWHSIFTKCANKMGKPLNSYDTMRASIEKAGFTNVQEANTKFPNGNWAKNPVYKEVGRVHLAASNLGLEGYAMFYLTNYGDPEPWTPEQAQVLLMQVRKDLENSDIHSFNRVKRVWAQKPFEKETTEAAETTETAA